MSNSRSKELTKNTFIITLGRISTQFITFLLLPLYTAFLSTEEYGTVDLITTLVQFIIPVMSLMVDQGVFRYLLNCETQEDKKRTISSAFFLLLGTCALTVVLYGIICIFVIKPYMLWLLFILIVTAFSNFSLQVARGLRQTRVYALGSFVCSAVTIILNVLCIAFLHMGAVGMLIASFLGNSICCVFLLFKLRVGSFISLPAFNKSTAIDELKYSVPLIPNQLSIWVMNSSDRLIVTFFLGAAANGILAVSHKFPAIYMSFFNIFQLAWHETGAVHYFDEDRDEFFTDMVKKILSIFAIFSMAVIVALPIVFDWFVNSSFREAYYNIPIYMVASLFHIVVGLLGVIYVATKRTTEIAKTTIIAAIINIVVSVSLIKYIGLYAASISTLVGYLVTMVYRIVDSRKYVKITFDPKQIISISISVGVCCFIYYLNNKVVSLIFLPLFIILAYIFNREIVNGLLVMIVEKIGLSKKKIMAIAVCALAVLITIEGVVVYKKVYGRPKEIQTVYEGDADVLEPERIIDFSDFGADDFTCTGITYDIADNTFWIGDYGALNINDQVRPRVVEVDKDFVNILREIDLDSVLDSSANLQGVAYDSEDDCLWLAVGKNITAVDKSGTIIKTIEMGKYANNKANGICYNKEDDSLWVLCSSQYLLHFKKDGTLLAEFSFNYANQDHICTDGDYLYVTVGADYQGDDNFVCKVSLEDGSIFSLFRLEQANALEGICIVDDRMLITNDGMYHSDLVGHSYITVFDEEEILR